MRTDQFDFELPPSAIAVAPVEPRDAARLLVVPPPQHAAFADHHVRDLADLLAPGDVLVVNDTRVIPAALTGERRRGALTAGIAINLLRRLDDHRWQALARPAKRLQVGDQVCFSRPDAGGAPPTTALTGIVAHRGGAGEVEIAFDVSGNALAAAIDAVGAMPLPPYIAGKRAPDARDHETYQTVYARHPGAVAAPTAGLHFTPDLLSALATRGIEIAHLTLHVGAGTFLPVKSEAVEDHIMHSEWGEITPATAAAINGARARGGRIAAVGTTCVRLIETAARVDGHIPPWQGTTDIFITPGYRFKAVDIMMTNFHLPRSTLFMLVSAFSGLERMQAAYAHAIASGYRFYSYGDACLLMGGKDAAR